MATDADGAGLETTADVSGRSAAGGSRSWVLPRQLSGPALPLARTGWLAVTATSTVLMAVGFMRAFAEPGLIALPALTDLFTALGLNHRLMITLSLVAPVTTVIAISFVVFWRRSTDPMALLFTLSLVLMYAYSSRSLLTFAGDPILRHGVSVTFAFGMVCVILVLGAFPDGRWAPAWSRWLLPAAVLLAVAVPDGGRQLMDLLDGRIDPTGPVRVVASGWCVLFLLGLLAQRRRYQRHSGPRERHQVKWVVFPLGSLLALFTLILGLQVVAPAAPPRWAGAQLFLAMPIGIALPLAVANAVLRFRLYEIDKAISRSVSYTLLTVVLLAIYGAIVTGLGSIVTAATGGGGDLVVATATLTVAAAFRPVRHRVQALVDRRFNRTHYDAQRTVEAFAQRLRDEVQLHALVSEIQGTTRQVLRPERVDVWLVPTGAAPGTTRARDPVRR